MCDEDMRVIAEDDADMKIAGDSFETVISDTAAQTAELYESQRANGNLDRAAALGTALAKAFPENEHGEDAHALQRQLLICFTVETTLDDALPNRLLKPIARASWRDGIRTLPALTQPAANPTGAFSFYYLCLKEEDVASDVGATFASLCGEKENDMLRREGRALYLSTRDAVIKAVATAGLCE